MNNNEISFPGKKYKILLIEDDDLCAYTVIRILKKNFEVVHKFTGSEGIAEAKNQNYDLVLMDIGLKEMSGLDVIKIIREIPHYKNIQIIAVTAFAMLGDREIFLENGFSNYLSKPFSISDLTNAVNKAINI
jgi:CheY-like chemotaxis protein